MAQGAEIIAHANANARADMQARAGNHIATLGAALKERAEGTMSTLPTRFVEGSDTTLELGGITLALRYDAGLLSLRPAHKAAFGFASLRCATF